MTETSVFVNGCVSAIQAPLAALGNVLVFVTVTKHRTLQTINNLLLLQLGVCDLLRGSILATIKAYHQLSGQALRDQGSCQLLGVFSCLSYLQSPGTLMLVALLHYTCIVKTKHFRRLFSTARVACYGLIVLLVNLTVAVLPIIGVGEYKYSDAHGMCFANWSTKQIIFRSFFYFLTFGIYYPPIVFCYLKIFAAVKRHNRLIGPNRGLKKRRSWRLMEVSITSKGRANTNGNVASENTDEARGENIQSQEPTGNSKYPNKYETEVAMVMFVIIVAYFMCWFPAFLLTTISSSGGKVPAYLEHAFITLIDIKALLNPFIYAFQSKQFRNTLLRMLRKCCNT